MTPWRREEPEEDWGLQGGDLEKWKACLKRQLRIRLREWCAVCRHTDTVARHAHLLAEAQLRYRNSLVQIDDLSRRIREEEAHRKEREEYWGGGE